jgi:outer membrane protein
MSRMCKFSFVVLIAIIMVSTFLLTPCQAKGEKIGYVDLRRAFYEYEKSKTFEKELNELTGKRQSEREAKIKEISKLRDEMELLSGAAREKKQSQLEAKISDLNEFDRDTRQQLLNKKNDMFREVVDDIQKVVNGLGEKEKYDFILDSRNIMYGREEFDLTDEVVSQLNK